TPVEGVEMRVVGPDGAPLPVGEVGEIAIRGHNVMKGYWRKPEATAEAIPDGWFRTGDLARVDEDGYFFIVDRKKEMIIRGGYNVYPREIEEVLYEHPAVAEAAVVGIAHDQLGEEVGAAVALKPGAAATPEELRAYVKDPGGAHNRPRRGMEEVLQAHPGVAGAAVVGTAPDQLGEEGGAAVALTPGAAPTPEELRAYVKDRVAAYKSPRHVWLVDELPKGPTGKILRREVRRPGATGDPATGDPATGDPTTGDPTTGAR